jgi:colicin import membrane protein
MSATAFYEPYRLPAGILALVVHSVFFALLYFGFNWNRQVFSTPTMIVELWQSLPEVVVAPPVTPRVAEVVPPPLEKKAEPDISIPDKKKAVFKPVETKQEKIKPSPKEIEQARKKIAEQDERIARQQVAREQAERLRQEELASEQAAREKAERLKQAEMAAATGKVVDEYKAKIKAKIKGNIVMPPNVPDNAHAEFMVTLLPGGAVMPPRLLKSSGNKAYDNAVERAILKSDPLPLPPDVQLFNRFRELDLVFKPEKRTE